MNVPQKAGSNGFGTTFVVAVIVAAVAAGSVYVVMRSTQSAAASGDAHDEHAHEDEHAHDHAGHSEEASIKLSANGLKNIGYRPLTLELGTYTRRINLPAMVVERPGRTQIYISSPLTGVVSKIYPMPGAAVAAGSPLFEIRLTFEELVTAQSDLIRTQENLDVVNAEIARLKSLTAGVVPGKRVLEQEYEKQKLEASLKAERQALLLHGLTQAQIDAITEERQLFQTLTVVAPDYERDGAACSMDHFFHVQEISVNVGQQVNAGERLGILADHCELYIEGSAFEDDASRLREASAKGWPVTAQLTSGKGERETIEGLQLLYLSDVVDWQSRAFRFYMALPNDVVSDKVAANDQRYVEWRFKPGQRMEVRVPVEQWENRLVLPVSAIVDEGAESYVYQQNGDHFDRVPVHVEFRDQESVVVANDGSVYPGDVIAARGAYQIHLAIKNKSGGAVDPHAGHNH
ncbi:efflux RND transporter periplasmic adaptor subunit [Blastopirellula sp. JC732]|uniref:Efflux RND transporter periplasmic adaptor subunit n=1 Tax=Blastopirellula sediminis TaxID=2894196 RepID=A0A9X1MJJ7_9BACT|nr:efflux RND transporter periplasmic adaptor subunit [Blastopirellula sediminis]MCC9608930.1 efflux RND transporter periplasmic adaptor subunit [Blastopirellula sediminis]MCC9628293.1 efflux RND transporter periplasmic adaptor subunit [Blastopirellula sediminis]